MELIKLSINGNIIIQVILHHLSQLSQYNIIYFMREIDGKEPVKQTEDTFSL